MDRWTEITEFCEAHHGVVDRTELTRLGVTRSELARLVRAARLERAAPRVWRLVGSPDTWRQRLSIGTMSLGHPAAASHGAAAQLHRFDRAPDDAVEFLVPAAARSPRLDATVHSSKLIRPHDFVVVDGIRATSATRTILDLANAGAHPDRVRAAIDTAVRRQLSAPQVIADRLFDIRRRGRGGVRLIDELLVDSGGHTMLERRFLELLGRAGLPRPAPQVVFARGARTVARVDFLYERQRLVVEVSGRLGHSSPSERARDAQRRNELQSLGYRVYEFTWEDIDQRPSHVVRTLRALLAAPRSVQRSA